VADFFPFITLTLIPGTLDKWDIKSLNQLINLRDIESDTFDFKGPDFKELANHFCAFANHSTGQMVLGIKEEKRNGYLVGFKKVGFDKDREDWVRNEVNNAMANVDPRPAMNIEILRDHDSIYPVLKIEGRLLRQRCYSGKTPCIATQT
jgi:predicted HTH transcriptional regulator